MLGAVDEQGVDWWGYIEGNSAVLAGLCLAVVAFAAAYLIQRFRGASIRAERKQRRAN